jgi:predicted NAD/FAD-binding protein
MKPAIAIIGGGVAGLTAAYLLQEKYHLTLFEKSGRIGGNAYTLTTPEGEEADIAACAFGKKSYKNLFKLFSKLHIETVSLFGIDPFNSFGLGLSFCNLDTKKSLYITPGLKGLLAQRFEILKPSHMHSIWHLIRGLKRAFRLLETGNLKGLSVAEALEKIPQLTGEAKLIFIGDLCLISSMHCDDVLEAPLEFFIEKLKTHDDLLPPKAVFSVHFTRKRTKSYVEALSSGYRDRIRLNACIKTVIRGDNKVTLLMKDGERFCFDQVVFACNADQALELLESPTAVEEKLLGAWKYTEGRVIVHSDHSHFPKKEFMNGYTFLYREKGRYLETSISGSLWILPGVSARCNLISTQHPNIPIDKDRIVFEKVFRTPLFDFNSCSTTQDLPALNGINNTYYCGSHFGFGVHEDAVSSAIAVADKLGVPF